MNKTQTIYDNKLPCRFKHLQENPLFADWFTYGKHPDGTVDIADPAGDVFVAIPEDVAGDLMRARYRFTSDIERIIEPFNIKNKTNEK